MFAQPKKHLKGLASAAIVLTLVGVLLVGIAFARRTVNTIDPVATITDNGRHIIVTGPFGLTDYEKSKLRVTVTQRSTGAAAEGVTHATGTGVTVPVHWKVHARRQGKNAFQVGPATAVAIARTDSHGVTTDAHQWLVNVTLVDDNGGLNKAGTEAAGEETFPAGYALSQNFPNPFNPETEILFQLPSASHVVVRIFNSLGQEIRTLADAQYEVGDHVIRWDGKDNNGNTVSSGLYFYRMQAGEFSQMKKMSLLR